MHIFEIDDEKKWNPFISSYSEPESFSQSFEWGRMLEQKGSHVIRLAVVDGDTVSGESIIAVAQVAVKQLVSKWKYVEVERGPVLDLRFKIEDVRLKIWEPLLKEIKKTTNKEGNVVFLRVSPLMTLKQENIKTIEQLGFQKPRIITRIKPPGATLLLDLKKSEEELLSAMHRKTRYNIRVAQKNSIEIHEQKNIDAFYTLLQKTAEHQKIGILSKQHYENLHAVESDNVQVKVFGAYHDKACIAAAMVVYFGNTTTYLHGASDYEHRKLMAPHGLHWEIIKDAKMKGKKWYDWWGISKMQNKNWEGITRFKKGFGNEHTSKEIEYIGTWDLVYQRFWYNIFAAGKKILNK